MTDPRLSQQLEKVAVRLRRLRLWRSMAAAWMAAAAAGLVVASLVSHFHWNFANAASVVFGFGLALAAYACWLAHTSCRDYHAVAQRVEAAYPELQSCLLTALEQRPTLEGRRFSFLQDRVIRQALNHAYGHNWPRIVPGSRIAGAVGANAAAFALLLFVLAGFGRQEAGRMAASALQPDASSSVQGLAFTVEPGDTEVERGTSLLVLARFEGPQPAGATLVYVDQALEPDEQAGKPDLGGPVRLNMAKSLDDPVFGGRVAVVDGPLDYHVEMADKTSDQYHVSVFEYPKLLRADARLVYPAYTGLDARLVEDVRTISAVEGTELTILCHLNKPVASASLVEEGKPPLELTAQSDPRLRQATVSCTKSRKLRLDLVDDKGRGNKVRTEITIKVLPNKPPDLKLAFPARDIEVSPLEETDVQATAWDDFGMRRLGLTYQMAGGEPVDVLLGENVAAKKRHELAHIIKLEDLKAEPDQLLAYHFWAEDFGPDGRPRRTESDMFFAEVRPFDEIFRQGQQPPSGEPQQQQPGGENAQAAEKLLQLQKEIINATWKVIRRTSISTAQDATDDVAKEQAGGQLDDDIELIRESQASALEQAEQARDKLTDPRSQADAGAAIRAMREAIDQLTAAVDENDAAPLRPALASEQAAYQALLKLRAREHSVVRARQAGGGQGGASRSQQQLQQLELNNDENRYETQRTAQSQSPEQRETRQVLNRLSELARRQNDLNERLKELQSALQEANSEPEREEIRRQLKRLREEQEEILRDTDELKSRMEQPENLERMADARQQLDETRDHLRRAGEALAEENASQASAAGTRAQRDFQELRNEFRQRASGEFSDRMRELRDDARQLDEKQREIAQELAGPDEAEGEKSLRGDDPREKVPDDLARQKERLTELLNRMRETIEEAETPEPLLAEQLYDAARKTQERNIERALEAAELSTRRGLSDDARGQERIAGEGIRELREGVERAAESVLGDETESLRRARAELDRLTDELSEEIDREGARVQGSGFREGEEDDPEQSGDAEQGAQRSSVRKPSQRRAQSPASPGEGRPTPDANPENTDRGTSSGLQREQSEGSQRNQGRSNESQSNEDQPNQGGQANQPGAPSGRGGRQAGERPNAGGTRGGGGTQRLSGGPNDDAGPGGFNDSLDAGKRTHAPITGEDFRDWSDRLRDVEEMMENTELRAQAARIRQQARALRAEWKRHSHEPNWKMVQIDVALPLAQLRDRVAEELLRRTSQDALLPLDRDPVPPKYQEKTRRYYERLGSGR